MLRFAMLLLLPAFAFPLEPADILVVANKDWKESLDVAKYYAETWANVDRGTKLINEALRKDPKNGEYLKIRAKLAKGAPGTKKASGIQIIRGKGH